MEQLWHQDESISADLKRKSVLYQLPECTRIYQVCLFCHIVLVYFQNSKKNIKMRGCNVNLCHMLMLTANNCLHRCLYFKEVGKRWLSDLRAWFIIAVHMHRIIKNNTGSSWSVAYSAAFRQPRLGKKYWQSSLTRTQNCSYHAVCLFLIEHIKLNIHQKVGL